MCWGAPGRHSAADSPCLPSSCPPAQSEPCAAVVARLHLVPTLIRLLPRDSSAFGPILRTLFGHSVVIQEMCRIGAIIDLMVLLAGGTASGPAPGKPGGPRLGTVPQLAVPKPARATAAALLSHMASDHTQGPPVLLAISQARSGGRKG